MKLFRWDDDKNEIIKEARGVSFEEGVLAIERGDILDILEHPNRRKYPNQRLFVVRLGEYAYLVPFVEDSQEIFLKTVISSRKATRDYIR